MALKVRLFMTLFSRPIQESKNGNTWEIHYDDVNRQVVRRHVETGEREIRKYDSRNNLIAFTDRGGFTLEQTYDALNRITTNK